ncbi:DUF3574 domain-containing protein [Ideonella azotifigens]|uniref:DUF3574 domain-containing protein n=2 Tax=Ideonella azotifigens TaxID=513160 RepID=A0ABN1KFV8_9BURK|nr:DUF3574 domain-containing protein [Ideonella azotifigens]MCD2340478.1 DUF3574 domain-containing protein [Ideonella azotifigens]
MIRCVLLLSLQLGALLMAGCANTPPALRCAAGETRAISDTLYFGTARPEGAVSPEDWAEFLRSSVTPRFPQGLSVWPAAGQWRGADGAVVREASFVLSLLHEDDAASDAAIRALVADYKRRFLQESVLRVRADVCMSF